MQSSLPLLSADARNRRSRPALAALLCRGSLAALLLLTSTGATLAEQGHNDSAQHAKAGAKSDDKAWHASWLKKWHTEQKKARAAAHSHARKPADAAKTPETAGAVSSAPPPAVMPTAAVPAKRASSTPSAASAKPAKPAANAFAAQTKPDGFPPAASTASGTRNAGTLDSPLSAIGDGGRMVMTMLPVLLLIVGGLHLLRRYQERTGRLPGLMQSMARRSEDNGAGGRRRNRGGGLQSLFGNFQRAGVGARPDGIRLVESLPLSGANLHVVEVRGRALLLGVTPANVQMLAELTEPERSEGSEFMAQLQAASADLDALDLEDPESPVETLVGSLEAVIQETHDAVNRRTRRLRAVRQEEEDDRA